MTARQYELACRDASIVLAWLDGESAREIADRHHVSADLVREIAHRTPDADTEREHRHHHRLEHLRSQALTWSHQHPGEPLQTGAMALGVTRGQLVEWLQDRVSLHPNPRRRKPRISDHQIIAALHEWHAQAGSDLREASYREAARANDWPSRSTVFARFGTWKTALQAAGIDIDERQGRGPTWTDKQLIDAARAYFESAPPPWTWRGMARWLADHDDIPSAHLIALRLGSWSAVIKLIASDPAPSRDG